MQLDVFLGGILRKRNLIRSKQTHTSQFRKCASGLKDEKSEVEEDKDRVSTKDRGCFLERNPSQDTAVLNVTVWPRGM